MIWYILTALTPFVVLAEYQRRNYRLAQQQHATKVSHYEKYKYYSDPGPFKFQRQWKYDTYDAPALLALAVTFGTAVVALIAGLLFSTYGPLEREEYGTFPLVAVSDGSKGQGSYFLFSGYYEESQTYSFYERRHDGGYTRGWQYASNSVIYQDAEPGTANLHQYHLKPNYWIGFEWADHLRNEFHVPAGTIKESMTLDNEN